ncbi:MAG: 3-isopropylmalate dehydrogenase [Bacteroidota bacterium]
MNYRITVLPGDGIGPEICHEAISSLNAVGMKFGHNFLYQFGVIGGAAIRETGNPYPDETHQKCLNCDAILFGAIGDPLYDNNPGAKIRPEQGLLAMRKNLGLYANIRPVKVWPDLLHMSPIKEDRVSGADLVVVRELTGGLYFGEPRGMRENGRVAVDTCLYSVEEIERITHVAFRMAGQRRKKVTLVDKANVLETSRLWRRVVAPIAAEYPDIELDYMFVDNASMQLIINPKRFDVILTENLFGDILSDEASVISGSIGLLPSASIGGQVPLFEPIHGSYPDGAGKNVANPLATILSAAMLLRMGLNLPEEADAIEKAVEETIRAKVLTRDLNRENPAKTSEVGEYVAKAIESSAKPRE